LKKEAEKAVFACVKELKAKKNKITKKRVSIA
jgi:hypothetical protein